MTDVEEVDLEVLQDKLHGRIARRKELNSLISATSADVHRLSLKTTELNRSMRTPRLVHRRKTLKRELFLTVDAITRSGTILAAQKRVLETEDATITNLSEEIYRGYVLSKPEGSNVERLSTLLGDAFIVSQDSNGARVVPVSKPLNSVRRGVGVDELLIDTSMADELYTAFDSLGYWISREITSGPAEVASFFKVVLETAQEFRLAVLLANPSS